jgi:hypothetical protein
MIPNLDLKRMIEMTNDQNKTVAAKVELTEEKLRTVSGGDKATSQAPVPVGNSILLATDIESGDVPALCERSVA